MTDQPVAARLRSRAWFDNPDNPDMTALYLERYLNYGVSREELMSGKPIIGIAQTGSDLSPCNRHHLELAKRVRDGIRDAGGIAMEFPVHPIQETGKRPTAGLDRNLTYLGLVEVLYGYPLDGVVLTIGCDKTTPALLMAAATVDIPAIALSVGPMLNGWFRGLRTGSGTIVWRARELLATGEIDYNGFIDLVASSAPSTGYCNTMGTATTMNSLAEALGMQLPGSAAIPAPLSTALVLAKASVPPASLVNCLRSSLMPASRFLLIAAKRIAALRVQPVMTGTTALCKIAQTGKRGVRHTIPGGARQGRNGPLPRRAHRVASPRGPSDRRGPYPARPLEPLAQHSIGRHRRWRSTSG